MNKPAFSVWATSVVLAVVVVILGGYAISGIWNVGGFVIPELRNARAVLVLRIMMTGIFGLGVIVVIAIAYGMCKCEGNKPRAKNNRRGVS